MKFVANRCRPVTVTNVEHVVDNDEWSLKPKKKNYWEITLWFKDSCQSAKYQMDTTPNLFAKYSIFAGEAAKIVPDANKELSKLIGKSMMICYTKTFILDTDKHTFTTDVFIREMQPIEDAETDDNYSSATE